VLAVAVKDQMNLLLDRQVQSILDLAAVELAIPLVAVAAQEL
jgi:hypothetical protein